MVRLVKQLAGSRGCLLLAEYPDRYPPNLKWFLELMPGQQELEREEQQLEQQQLEQQQQQLLEGPMPLARCELQHVMLPLFVNEMRDVPGDTVSAQLMLFRKGG